MSTRLSHWNPLPTAKEPTMRFPRRSILLFAAFMVLALSGCNWVVGDSIAYLAKAELEGTSTGPKVDADAGRGAYTPGLGVNNTGWSQVKAHIGDVGSGQWMVVEIGTNDLAKPETEWVKFITDVVALVPNDRCLAWVTPYKVGYATQAARYKTLLSQYLATQPCRGFVQWDNVARNRPEYTYDGYHPTAAGTKVLACMVDRVLNKVDLNGYASWCINQYEAGLL